MPASTKPTEVVFNLVRNGASADMNVDGSVTPVHFDYVAVNDRYVDRCNFVIIDGGITPIKFGGISGGLTNGVLVRVVDSDDATVLDFLEGETIKKNADWDFLAGTDNIIENAAGDDHMCIRWTLSKGMRGKPMYLPIGWKLRFTVQDDLTPITQFRIMVQGTT